MNYLMALPLVRLLTGTGLLLTGLGERKIAEGRSVIRYDDPIRMRDLEYPASHDVTYRFDKGILQTIPVPKQNGYNMFKQIGSMNGKKGMFEMEVDKNGVVDHCFFRPNK